MRRLVLAACVLMSVVLVASAADFQLPKTQPVVTATMPDAWGPVLDDEYLVGNVMKPPFQAKVLWFAKEDGERQLENAIRNFKNLGDIFDPASARQQETQTINGMKYTSTRYDGKDSSGKPLVLYFGILETSKDKNFRITAETDPDGEKEFAPAVTTFVQSFKPL